MSCQTAFLIDSFRLKAYLIKPYMSHSTHFIRSRYISRGVLCMTYPKNNTEDFTDGKYLDTSGAIGLNLFDTPSRAASSKQAVFKQGKTIQGPITLAQGNLSVVDEALIARYPVFMDGQNMTIDGQEYPFWGLT